MNHLFSRRQVIKTGILTAVGSSLFRNTPAAIAIQAGSAYKENKDPWNGFKVGIASYTFRKLSVADTIKAMQQLGLNYISIKDFHLSLTSSPNERKAVIRQFTDAGITPISCGNITMENDEGNIRRAFQYAKDCNIPTIVCSPHPDSMPILDRMVKEYDIRLAIHNHGPEDKRFPAPSDVWKAVQSYDARIGMCIDVGHTARAKADPAAAIVKYRERLYDLHFKDINSTEPSGATIQAGRGVLNLAAIVQSLIKIKYDNLVGIEYEGFPDNPIPAVSETIGYLKGMLAGMSKK